MVIATLLLSFAGLCSAAEEIHTTLESMEYAMLQSSNLTNGSFWMPGGSCQTDCPTFCANIQANSGNQVNCVCLGCPNPDNVTDFGARRLNSLPLSMPFIQCVELAALTSFPTTLQDQIAASQACCRLASCAGAQMDYCFNVFATTPAGITPYQAVYCDTKHSKKGLLGLLGLLGLIPLLLCCLLLLLCCLRKKKAQPDVHFASFDPQGPTPIVGTPMPSMLPQCTVLGQPTVVQPAFGQTVCTPGAGSLLPMGPLGCM